MKTRGIALAAAGLVLAAAAPPPLTPDGWNGLRIGMSEREAVSRFGLILPKDEARYSEESCRQLETPRHPGLLVMVEKGRVTRISLSDGSLRTDRGLTVGSSERDVRKAYDDIEVLPHTYDEPPAGYLTYWDPKRGRGVRYETNQRRRVTAIHVGGPSIRYIEGCL